MPRGRDEMQVNVAGLRRNIKNLAHNYSDAQVKVREATSNDPWGPSSTLMAEIADLTYNVMAFTEIMQMIWKRLNDHGKNWRHVYKALVLLEYLLRTGSDRVALQCKENIYAIQTLKDFQYMEEGKDQGLNVREKAKQLVILLKDEERLKAERERAMKAKQRFAQSASGFGSDAALDAPSSPTYPALSSESAEWTGGRETEMARPLTAGEEELQLQLALAMSREEAEREEKRRRSDDVRLQLALSQSQQDFQTQEFIRQEYFRQECLRLPSITERSWLSTCLDWPDDATYWPEGGEHWPDGGEHWPDGAEHWPDGKHWLAKGTDEMSISGSCWLYGCYQCLHQNVQQPDAAEPASHLLDLLDVNLSPAPAPAPRALPADPWHLPSTQDTSAEPWAGGSPARDPWAPAAPPDPWAPAHHPPPLLQSKSPTSVLSSPSSTELEQFDALSQRRNHNNNPSPDPFDLTALESSLAPVNGTAGPGASLGAIKKSPSAFLGENSSLVNLERLLQAPAAGAAAPHAPPNPFAEPARLFAPPPPAKLSINELKQQQMGLSGLSFPPAAGAFGGALPAPPAAPAPADPWAPAPAPRAASPWSPPHQRHTPNPFLS